MNHIRREIYLCNQEVLLKDTLESGLWVNGPRSYPLLELKILEGLTLPQELSYLPQIYSIKTPDLA